MAIIFIHTPANAVPFSYAYIVDVQAADCILHHIPDGVSVPLVVG